MWQWWLLTRVMLTLHLLTWSIYFLQSGLFPSLTEMLTVRGTHTHATLTAAQTVETSILPTLAAIRAILAAEFARVAAWSRMLLCTGKQCTAHLCLRSRATINAFITGTSASVSSCCSNLKSLAQKCSRLPSAYATAHTQLSTKTLSARYSDL